MVFHILFAELAHKNDEFLELLINSLKFNNYMWSMTPSLLFLIFSMNIVYRITHKNAQRFQRNTYREAVYREIAFQWLYLYVTRGWLYVVKGLRLASAYLEEAVIRAGGSEMNAYSVHLAMFIVFILISLLPLVLTMSLFSKDEIMEENILFWIPPNRWTRSELGTAGRLMERPPDIIFANTRYPHAYETKRSVSSELSKKPANVDVIRCCRSGCISEQVSSMEEMVNFE